jgi:hypothetical protein
VRFRGWMRCPRRSRCDVGARASSFRVRPDFLESR